MAKFSRLALVLALAVPCAGLVLPGPALAQFSESYKFLEAVKKKEGQQVTDMLAEGSPNLVSTRDVTSGETALHLVTQRRDPTWLQFLIARGANVNVRDGRGVTPLVLACNLNFVEGVEALIKAGARIDDTNGSGETPLITAVHNRNVPLVRILLQAGANPDRADNSGRTARDYATLAGSTVILGAIDSEAKARAAKGQGAKSYGPKL